MIEQVFLNDKLVDKNKAFVSTSDSGFLYGAGLFETMRSYKGIVFLLEDHLDRLFCSAGVLGIETNYDKKFITDAIYNLLEANKLADARLRLTLTSGPFSKEGKEQKSTLLITATQLQPYPQEYYQKGVLVVLCPYRQNTKDPVCGHKTTNYFSRMLALRLAHQKRAAEALWFTETNYLAEGCISNIFLVKDSTLFTPRTETPILPGIARKTTLQIAAEQSVKLQEKSLSIDDVLEAEEIFLTNTIMQILPVYAVENHAVGNGKMGPVTKKLMKYYEEFVKKECEQKDEG
ncbi:MAG: aminotransferase class IV [Planctomycetota bacterium]|jgi:branched-chain amino acid aminotransferase